MSIIAALAGGGALAASFGKGLVKNWARKLGPENLEVAGEVFKRWGMGINYIPAVGPAALLHKGLMRGGIKEGISRFGQLRSRLARRESALSEVMTGVLSKTEKSRIFTREAYKNLEPSRRKIINKVQVEALKSLKSDPKRYAQNISQAYQSAAVKYGIPSEVVDIQNKVLRSAERVRDTAEHAMASRDLLGTFLVSNMAAVGMPTLGHTVASVQIAKYLNRKVGNRLRGYNDDVYIGY